MAPPDLTHRESLCVPVVKHETPLTNRPDGCGAAIQRYCADLAQEYSPVRDRTRVCFWSPTETPNASGKMVE